MRLFFTYKSNGKENKEREAGDFSYYIPSLFPSQHTVATTRGWIGNTPGHMPGDPPKQSERKNSTRKKGNK